jgi:hypothetical protein
MATFEATHESADFSEWTGTVLDSGKLTVSSDAGMGGTTYGQKYVVDNTNAKYAYKTLASASTTGVAQLRIYFDPGGLSYSEFDAISPGRLMTSGGTSIATITNTIVGGNLCMRVVMFADDGSHSDSGLVIISDSPHFIEMRATKATNSTANDAKIEWWVDDEAQTTLTGVDCFDRWTNIQNIVAGFATIPSGASGTAYIDEVSWNDSGDYIGSADGGVSTGLLSATSASSLSSGVHSDNDWSDASNITANDGSDASITAPTFDTADQSYLLLAHFSGLSAVPDGATIIGVEVQVNCYYANGSVSLDLIQLLDATGAPAGDNQAATPIPLGTSAAGIVVLGGSADLWGNSLTDAWVKDADFGVAVGFLATGDNADVFVDYVSIKIFYTETGGTTYNLTATLSGSSQLDASGFNTFGLSAAEAASSQLTGIGRNTHALASTQSVNSALTTQGFNSHALNALLAGSSQLDVIGFNIFQLTAALAADSQLTASGGRAWALSALLAADSALTAQGFNSHALVTALAVSSELAASGRNEFVLVAALSMDSVLVATVPSGGAHNLAAVLGVNSQLNVSGFNTLDLSAAVNVSSLLEAAGFNVFSLDSAMNVSSGLTASGVNSHALQALLDASSELTASGRNEFVLAASLSVDSVLVAMGTLSGLQVYEILISLALHRSITRSLDLHSSITDAQDLRREADISLDKRSKVNVTLEVQQQ